MGNSAINEPKAEEPTELRYASLEPATGLKVWTGVAILLAALALIALGGCFLMGVLVITTQGFVPARMRPPLSASMIALMWVLYALAFASFGFAVAIFGAGLRALFRVMRQ